MVNIQKYWTSSRYDTFSTYIHTYIHIYLHTYKHLYTYIQSFLRLIYPHTDKHTKVHKCFHKCFHKYTYIHSHTFYIHTNIHTVHTCTHYMKVIHTVSHIQPYLNQACKYGYVEEVDLYCQCKAPVNEEKLDPHTSVRSTPLMLAAMNGTTSSYVCMYVCMYVCI